MRWRTALLLAVVALLCSGCWFQVGGNSFHTGFNATESSVTSETWSGLHRVWRGQVNAPQDTGVPSSVAVAFGTVFVHGLDGTLDAFDVGGDENCSGTPRTCTPRWSASAGGGSAPPSDPATDGSTVYLGGANGKLYAFDGKGETNCSGSPKICAP